MLQKIWVIDDDKIFRYTSERYLREINPDLDIQTFDDAEDALDELLQASADKWPELIFIDVNMPVVDGWDFLEGIKGHCNEQIRKIKYYVVSSSVDHRDQQKSQEYEFVLGYKVKPISIEEFEEIIS